MRVRVDLDVVRNNARALRELLGGEVVGVVKGVNASPPIVDAVLAGGVDRLAVSRVAHLRQLRDVDAEVTMLRIPAPSEVEEVVAHADVALHGSREVLRAANESAARRGVTHAAIPMVDAGEGREGVPPAEAEAFLDLAERLEHVRIAELGINLGCYHDLPDPDAVRRIVDRLPDYPVSVGGSGMVVIADDLPDAVASYRVGDALLTGRYVDAPIDGLHRGGFELQAAVLATRPDDALVDVGNVTSDPRHLSPRGDLEIERWSNEMAVVDEPIPEGEHVSFEMWYDAIATTFSSRYVPGAAHHRGAE